MRYGHRERIMNLPGGPFPKNEHWKASAPGCISMIAIESDRGSKPRSTAARISPPSFDSCFLMVVCVGRQRVDAASRRQTEKTCGSGEIQWTRRRKKTWMICFVWKSMEFLVPDRFASEHPGYRGQFLAVPTARAMGAGRELFARRKDGNEFPVEIGLNPIQTPEGILVLAVVVDISARLAAEEAARRSRE